MFLFLKIKLKINILFFYFNKKIGWEAGVPRESGWPGFKNFYLHILFVFGLHYICQKFEIHAGSL